MESAALSQTYQAPASLLQDRVRAYFVLYAVTPLLLRAVGFASFAGSLPRTIETVGEYIVFLAAYLYVLRIFETRIYNSEHRSSLVALTYCLILPFVFSICAALLGSLLLLVYSALEGQLAFAASDFRETYDDLIGFGMSAIETSEPWRTFCYIGLGLLSVVITHLCGELSHKAFHWRLAGAIRRPALFASLRDLRPLFALVTIAPIASLFASQVSYTTKYLAQVSVSPLVFLIIGVLLIYVYFRFVRRSPDQMLLAQWKVIIFSLFLPYVARWVMSLLDSFITAIYTIGVYFGDGSPPRPDLLFELTHARYLFPITNNAIAALVSLFVVEFLSASAESPAPSAPSKDTRRKQSQLGTI